MIKKPIVTLSAALILVLSAGCQSQQSTQSSPKQENTQKEPQSQTEQKEEVKQETPAAGQQDKEKANTETNGNAESTNTDSQTADQEKGNTENGTDSDSSSDSQSSENTGQTAENPDVPYMSPFELREELQLGMTKQQVGDLLQNSNPAEVKGENGDTLYRYDYMMHDGAKPAEDKEYDADALKSDKLEAQIAVKWGQDGKAESFTIYHKNDDGHILKYHSDSSIQEETTVQ